MAYEQTVEKKPAQVAGGDRPCAGSVGGGAFPGVLGHEVNDGGNLVEPSRNAVFREAIFGSKLAQQVGVDDLMLQWLYLRCVHQPEPPSLKRHLQRLFAKVAAGIRAFFKPRHRDRWNGTQKRPAERKEAVGNSGIKGHGDSCSYRLDADIVLRREEPPIVANVVDVVW